MVCCMFVSWSGVEWSEVEGEGGGIGVEMCVCVREREREKRFGEVGEGGQGK